MLTSSTAYGLDSSRTSPTSDSSPQLSAKLGHTPPPITGFEAAVSPPWRPTDVSATSMGLPPHHLLATLPAACRATASLACHIIVSACLPSGPLHATLLPAYYDDDVPVASTGGHPHFSPHLRNSSILRTAD
jgi:hypothetical protein